jgi:hypothetical protein
MLNGRGWEQTTRFEKNLYFQNLSVICQYFIYIGSPQSFRVRRKRFPDFRTEVSKFSQKNDNSPTAEFYLPTAVTAPDVLNKIITIKTLPTRDRWLGITYPDDCLFVENQLDQWIAQGVYKI